MSKGIQVSPKHGLNPTIPVCFWCGKERGEVALLGRLPGDAEAPKNVVLMTGVRSKHRPGSTLRADFWLLRKRLL